MLSKITPKTFIKTLLKLIFSVGALIFIFQYLHIETLLSHIKELSFSIIIGAFIINLIGQYVVGLRFHFYCQSHAINIEKKRSLTLYFIGLFFNHLLPGGIGGDGYIAVMLKRLFATPIKKSIQLLLSARASGLLALLLLSGLLAYASQTAELMAPNSYILIAIVIIITIATYSLVAHRLLNEQRRTQLKAATYSFSSQSLIILFYYLLLSNMNIDEALILDYLVLLLVSNLLILIPVSFGGLGLRELGFLYASQFIGLNPEVGVAISLMHYSFNLTLSLVGLGFFATGAANNTEK